MLGDVITVLLADAELLALVSASNISAVKRKQGQTGPALVVDYSNIRTNPTKDKASEIDFADLVIVCYASTPLLAQQIADAVRSAMDAYSTVINSQLYEFRFTTAQTGYDKYNEEVYTVEAEWWACYRRNADGSVGSGFYISGYMALLVGFSVTPTQIATPTGGTLWQYTYPDNVTRYRFIPDTYNTTDDAFYSQWNGSTYSGLLARRSDLE